MRAHGARLGNWLGFELRHELHEFPLQRRRIFVGAGEVVTDTGENAWQVSANVGHKMLMMCLSRRQIGNL